MAQISIPMPLGVPMTMQTFAITLAAVVLGSKLSAIATLVYLALGAVGVPVLANFSGGFDKFVGPTGGFLISFPLMAYIIGLGVEHRDAFKGAFVTAVIVGTVVNYVVGVALFVVVAHSTIAVGISACVLPFIPTAIIKAVLACAIGLQSAEAYPGSEGMSIVLRPHHLLCTQGYSGKGYDNDFVAHMTDVVHQLRDVPGTTIRLTFSTDTLCSCCPNKLGDGSLRHAGKGQALRRKDGGILRPRGKGIRLSGPHPRHRRQSHTRDPRRHLPRLLLVPHQRLLQEHLRRPVCEVS